jgi:protein-disulfide isomerase
VPCESGVFCPPRRGGVVSARPSANPRGQRQLQWPVCYDRRMSRFLVLSIVVAAACQPHNKTLERKVDDLAAQLERNQRELADLRARLEKPAVIADTEAAKGDAPELERKLDEIQRKVDSIAQARPSYPPRPSRPEPDRAKTYAIKVDGYPFDGPVAAKVTLVMAHDYADPFSNKSRATLEELRKKYGQDLRVVFRNFVVHPRNAMAGALASCAAAKQKKFDALEDLLWEKGFQQRQLDITDVDTGQGTAKCWDLPDGCQIVVGFARDVGLKLDRFKADMKACVAEVQADMSDLQTFGLGATPGFFINGRFLSGAQPTEAFSAVIDDELAKATDRIKKGTPAAKYYKTWVLEKGLPKLEPTP